MDADNRLAELAAGQHAVVGRRQALDMGFTTASLDRRVAEGRLVRLHHGVYAVAGAPTTWHQHLLGACLAAGGVGVASHRAAARLWRLHDDGDQLEITVPLSRAPRLRRVLVHRSTDLHPHHVVRRRGIPVTNPLRTMVDLGAVLGPEQVEDAMDRGLAARLFSVAALEWMLDELGRSGRAGCGVLRRVLDDRALVDHRPDGLLEPRMARLLRDADLPPAHFQHVVRDRSDAFVARVDFAYPDVRLAIEVDGLGSHASREALQSDLDRQNALVSLGWAPLRFTWPDVVRRPAAVADRIRALLCTLSLTP